MPPFLFTSSTMTLMIFSSSPWLLSMNCSRHLKSTTTNATLIDVFVTPLNESVSAADADDEPDPPPDDVFLSLLHAVNTSTAVRTMTTPDRNRAIVPPTRCCTLRDRVPLPRTVRVSRRECLGPGLRTTHRYNDAGRDLEPLGPVRAVGSAAADHRGQPPSDRCGRRLPAGGVGRRDDLAARRPRGGTRDDVR